MSLNITLSTGIDCSFTACDQTSYGNVDDTIKYAMVEFMCYIPYIQPDVILAISKSKRMTYFKNDNSFTIDDKTYRYNFDQDGRYQYYKYQLLTIYNTAIWNGTQYLIEGKVFAHNGVIYRGIKNTTEAIFDNSNTIVISNWYDLKNYVSDFIINFYSQNVFTICNLNKCLIDLQRKVLFDGLKNCNIGECEKDKSAKLHRDFVFASVYVLQYLIDKLNYDEAQRIVESLATCGSLCNDSLSYNNKCNCGPNIW